MTPDDARARGPAPRAARPVPDRPRRTTTTGTASRRSSSSCATTRLPGDRRARRGLSRTGYYGETPETMARRPADAARRPSGGLRADAPDGLARASGRRWTAAIRGHGAREVRHRHRAPRPRRQASRACPVHDLLGLSADIPPTDFTLGIDEPAVVAERARAGGGLPGAQDQGAAARRDLATLEAVRGVYGGPLRVDANTGWTPEGAGELLPDARAPRRRAHRAAVPGAAASTSCAGSRSARRCRSSPTRAA